MPVDKKSPQVISKGLKYSVVTTVINFHPEKFSSQTIVVNGSLAVRLKGRVYTKI